MTFSGLTIGEVRMTTPDVPLSNTPVSSSSDPAQVSGEPAVMSQTPIVPCLLGNSLVLSDEYSKILQQVTINVFVIYKWLSSSFNNICSIIIMLNN